MARSKSHVNLALSRSHLHAIGLVAAHWNTLEIEVLYVMRQLANVPFNIVLALATPSNFAAWLDMLRRLTRESKEHRWKEPQLKKICEKLKGLQTARNSVVHAAWQDTGQGAVKASTVAFGIGFPKRGLRVALEIDKSAAEIRGIAKAIAAADEELLDWWEQPPPKP